MSVHFHNSVRLSSFSLLIVPVFLSIVCVSPSRFSPSLSCAISRSSEGDCRLSYRSKSPVDVSGRGSIACLFNRRDREDREQRQLEHAEVENESSFRLNYHQWQIEFPHLYRDRERERTAAFGLSIYCDKHPSSYWNEEHRPEKSKRECNEPLLRVSVRQENE